MKSHSDQKYIEALKQQDAKLIEEIYAKYSGLIRNHVVNNSGTVSDAKDVFQEALVALYHKAEQGFVLESSFKAYFTAMCRYIWLDRIRDKKRKKEKEVSFREVTNSTDLGEVSEELISSMLKEQQFQLFREKFAELPPHCREIIGVSLLTDQHTGKAIPLKEVAEQLGREYGYVRKEKSLCIKKLIAAVREDSRYKGF